jgi:hypothetical protein
MNIEPTAIAAVNPTVTGAIRNAAQLTGASFEYLLATARVESNLNPQSAASTSSAKGLFQFISQTWLSTLKQQGPALGYGRFADAIERLPSGQYTVSDPKLSQQIMNLRADPATSALMAGAFTRANNEKLSASLGRAPNEGELYIAHFLGASGAAKLIDLAQTQPQANAAQTFTVAAAANRPIFYDRQGQPRTAADVYRVLLGRYAVARADKHVAPAAQIATTTSPTQFALAEPSDSKDTSRVQDTLLSAPRAAPTVPPVNAAIPKTAAPPNNEPRVFYSLFRTIDSPTPIAPVVNALWGVPQPIPVSAKPAAPAPPTVAPAVSRVKPATVSLPAAPATRPSAPRDLFQLFRSRS